MPAVSKPLEAVTDSLFGSTSHFNMFTPAPEAGSTIPGLSEALFSGPSGGSFQTSQLVSMGANPAQLAERMLKEIALISTFAGLRDPKTGEAAAFGAHSGHDRLDQQMLASASEIDQLGGQSRVAYTSGGCDGVWQGTPNMAYSLVSRNTMYQQMLVQLGVFPNMRAAIAFAACDKEGPAATAAIAHLSRLVDLTKKRLVGLIVPGGVMLPSEDPEIWDTGKVQTVNGQVNFGLMSREQAARQLCHACTKTGGGCQFFGTAASQQAITEALGLIIPHGACVPSSTAPWLDVARNSAQFVMGLVERGLSMKDLLGEKNIHNAMAVMAATGASTNMFMHLAFIARAAGLNPPAIEDYKKIFSQIPRILRVLPNGPGHPDYPRYPKGFPTAMFWAAGGVPEIMLALRELGVLELDAMTVTGSSLGNNLKAWEKSERRKFYRDLLRNEVGVNPDHVIMPLDQGIPSSYTFPTGNLCTVSVCKSSSIDSSLMTHGIYKKVGTARVFSSEVALRDAINAGKIGENDIICFIGRGIIGSGLEEVYEFTAQLAHIPKLKKVAIITDARFSGVTTGACIGHIIPEALAGGPCGKLRDGDYIEIYIDSNTGDASVNLIGSAQSGPQSAEFGAKLLAGRSALETLVANDLPEVVQQQALLLHALQEDWLSGYFVDNGKLHRLLAAAGVPRIPGYPLK